jgi:flagellum-specific ATP synthase
MGANGRERTAVVVGFREGEVLLQPLGHLDGIRPGDQVTARRRPLDIPVGPGLIGRIIDGVGNPLDGRGPIAGSARRGILADPPPALGRQPITRILETGLKVVDTLFTIGKGQRLGIFSGSGIGKSVLLGEMAKYAKADVNVIALVGERGREVGEFVDQVLGPEGRQRSVVIIATSDRPAIERISAAYAAHTVAEHFRDAGLDVLLMMDSVTRFCQAQREIGLAAGEPPVTRGFPPSAFSILPRLLERSGTGLTGSITGLYTILIEGDDENDPVGDAVRAILDGHLFLSRRLAGLAVYPAVDPTLSISRLLIDLASPTDYLLALKARELWSEYERVRDLVEVGAYRKGADANVDRAIAVYPRLIDFVRQPMGTTVGRAESLALLRQAIGEEAAHG